MTDMRWLLMSSPGSKGTARNNNVIVVAVVIRWTYHCPKSTASKVHVVVTILVIPKIR